MLARGVQLAEAQRPRWSRPSVTRPRSSHKAESNQIKPSALLSALLATPNPSNAIVLKSAKRLRSEVIRVSQRELLGSKIKVSSPYLAKRDNLCLYTRLVRLQAASYHSSEMLQRGTDANGAHRASGGDMNEAFQFVPPPGASAGGSSRHNIDSRNLNNVGDRKDRSPFGSTTKGGSNGSKMTRDGSSEHMEASGGSSPASSPQGWSFGQFVSGISGRRADGNKQEPNWYSAPQSSSTGLGGASESANASSGGFNGSSSSSGHESGANGVPPNGEFSKTNPLPVYIIPSKWNWVGYALTIVLILVVLYSFTREGPGGGSESILSLLGNKFEVAEPRELTFDDVKGNVEAKEELFDVVEYLKNPEEFVRLGIKTPKGILLTGPPGTGKTLLARALASESGVPFISTSGSEFEEMLVGVGARRIRQLFDLARKNAPCIVFIDEFDAIGARRDDMLTGSHRMSINQLLVEIDGFTPTDGVIVIAATNLGKVLDPALIRPGRFDRSVVMELPDLKARKEILDHYLKNKKISGDVSTSTLARSAPGFSGADLESMVNWAAIISAKTKNPKITMKTLEEALLNVAMGRERKSMVLNDHTRRLCAYHEGGHALVSLKTPGSMDIRRATLVPRGEALGMVNYLDKEDSPITTQKEMLAKLDTCMGGRAAEELIYGPSEITQGAGSDIEQATRIATTMVMQLGMSPVIGPVHLSMDKNAPISPETRLQVEQETRRLLKESYDRAYSILKSNEGQLHLLAKALLKFESLTVEEIRRAINGDPLDDKFAELQTSREASQLADAENAASRLKLKEEAAEKRRRAKEAAAAAKNASSSGGGGGGSGGSPPEEPKVKVSLANSSKDD